MQFNAQQFAGLSDPALERFLLRMRAHLRKEFPQQCSGLTGAQLDEISRDGVHRAEEYRIRAQREVCKFIDLMFVLGPDFDHRHAWMADALRNAAVPADERVTRLVQSTMAALPHA